MGHIFWLLIGHNFSQTFSSFVPLACFELSRQENCYFIDVMSMNLKGALTLS
jgi:hypothetical protein